MRLDDGRASVHFGSACGAQVPLERFPPIGSLGSRFSRASEGSALDATIRPEAGSLGREFPKSGATPWDQRHKGDK